MSSEGLLPRRRLIVLGALWLSIVGVLFAFRSVVLFFAAAAIIAYVVAPLVGRIAAVRVKGRQVPRWAAILTIYAAFFLVVYLAILALVPKLYGELARISRETVEYANSLTPQRIEEMSLRAEEWLAARGLPVGLHGLGGDHTLSVDLQALISDAVERIGRLARDNFGDIVNVSRRVVGGVLAGVFMLFFVLMVAAYMSIDAQKIGAYARSLIPPEYAGDVMKLLGRIDRSLAGVVRGQVVICLVNGVLTFVGLALFEVKFAFLLATVATVLSLIPIFGSIISSVPIVAIGLSQSWQTGLGALGWIIGIHALEAYVLNPKIMGSAARIHPIIVAFALIAGERTFGLVGALFAVPIAAIAVACFDFARLKVLPPEPAPALTAVPRDTGTGD
ncbi:MAG: AI-2E family transporter [Myxococcota bacterium]